MEPLQQIAYYLLILSVFFLVGFPLTLLLVKEKQYKLCAPLSFLMGAGVLMLACFYLSYCNIPFVKSSRFLAAAALFFFVSVCLIKRKKLIALWTQVSLLESCLWCTALLGGVLSLLIVITFRAPFMACDGYTYICTADYLLHAGYSTQVPVDAYHPWLSQAALYLNGGFRIGAQMLLSFFTALVSNTYSIELFVPLTAVAVTLMGLAGGLFVKLNLSEKRSAVMVGILFVVCNVPIVLWNGAFGFLPQSVGSLFYLAAMAVFAKVMDWGENTRLYSACGALFAGCAVLSYNEMLPFFAVCVGAIVLHRSFLLWKERNAMGGMLRRFVLSTAGAILSICVFLPKMLQSLFFQMGANSVGWAQPYTWWTYLGHLFSSVPSMYNYSMATAFHKFFAVLCTLFTLVMLYLFCASLYRALLKKAAWARDLLLISIPFFFLLIYFSALSDDYFTGGKGNSWQVFKLVQYYFVFAAPYLAYGLFQSSESHCFPSKGILRLIPGVVLVGFLAFNGASAVILSRELADASVRATGSQENPIGEYYRLAEAYQDETRTINLHMRPEDQKHRQMVTYFLRDHALASDWNTDNYFPSVPPAEFATDGLDLLYQPENENAVAGMVRYTDTPQMFDPAEDQLPIRAEGLYSDEGDFCWAQPNAVVTILDDLSGGLTVELARAEDIYCIDKAKAPGYVTIYVNDACVYTGVIPAGQRIPIIVPGLDIKNNASGNMVRISLNVCMNPKEVGISEDNRDLAAQLFYIGSAT